MDTDGEQNGTSPRWSPRFLRVFALTLGIAATGWVALYAWVVPGVLRAAYGGARIWLVTDALEGRGTTPLDVYLERGRALLEAAGIGLAVAFALGFVVWTFRVEIGRALTRWTRGGGTRSGWRLSLSSALLGLVLGLIEVGLAWARFRSTGYISTYNDPGLLWMAPLSQALAFLVLSLLLFHALGGRRRGVNPALVLGLFATLGVAGVILGLSLGLAPLYLGLHPAAVLLLALGIGVSVGRAMASRARVMRITSRIAIPAMLGLALAPLIAAGLDRWREDARLRSLPAAGDAPSVIFLVWDTVRIQNLHLYGYARPNTPTLERLAADGAVFEMAVATSPWTLPTHGSFFTGRLPYELSSDFEAPLDARFPTLAGYFRERGFRTGGFAANFDYTAPGSGLERGFIHYEAHERSLGTFLSASTLLPRLARLVRREPRLPWRKRAPEVTSSFLRWLDRDPGRPVFAFLNYWDAHAPYELYPEFLNGPRPAAPGVERATSRRLGPEIDAYDSSIGLMDDSLGELLRGLDSRGLLESSIIVLVSDHGEHLGEHGLTSHANSLYAPLLRVPLVIRAPGVPGGTTVRAAVSVRDLPATLVDLAGFDGSAFPGRSLRPLLTASGDRSSGPVLAELSQVRGLRRPPGEPVEDGPMKTAILDGLQLIRNGDGEEELYDWMADPASRRNLIDAHGDSITVERMRGYLREVTTRDTLCGFRYAERAGGATCR